MVEQAAPAPINLNGEFQMATKQTTKAAAAVAALLTMKQVMAGFKVSDMTIFTWRKGTATRARLPSHAHGNRVLFKDAEMAKYAKTHGLVWDSAAAVKAVASAKMGPKTAPAAKKAVPEKAPKKGVKAAAKAKFARVARTVNKQAVDHPIAVA